MRFYRTTVGRHLAMRCDCHHALFTFHTNKMVALRRAKEFIDGLRRGGGLGGEDPGQLCVPNRPSCPPLLAIVEEVHVIETTRGIKAALGDPGGIKTRRIIGGFTRDGEKWLPY